MSFQIIGTGRSHPDYVLTNEKLSTMVETSDEWITTRTGIKSRYVSTGETLFDLASDAGKKALANAGMGGEELDLIVCSTIQGDYQTPSLACMVQTAVGANCPAFDINAACSGFIYALDVAASFMDAGRAKNVLVISGEMMSRHVDWEDRATCVLFGDGAGAVVLTKGDGLRSIRITAKGDEKMLLQIGVGKGNNPFLPEDTQVAPPYLKMAGSEVFRFAVTSMCHDVKTVVEEAGITLEDVRFVIPHQANMRILHSAVERLKLKEEQVISAMDRYGNTSSASIPTLIDELHEAGKLQRGDYLVLSAFGGGLTTGACVIRY